MSLFSDAPVQVSTGRRAGASPVAFPPVPAAAAVPADQATSTVQRGPGPQPVGLKVGYARVSTAEQDLTAQRSVLAALGVEEARVYVDHGLTDANLNHSSAAQAARKGTNVLGTPASRIGVDAPELTPLRRWISRPPRG